ncbi:MAG: carboxypeptidase-like regulatory domain-containing protein [Planctomycetaceae bacterium]|nr:carboxypeptidase-like regulatory domain-containing protein [Planctomycetaceae bacterium]
MKKNLLISVVCLLALGSVIGCGPKNPLGVIKVTGKVTMDGQAVEGARVSFVPQGGGNGQLASATTNSEGVYSLTTAGAGDAMGAIPGTYQVTIAKNERIGESTNDDNTPPEERQISDSYALAKIIKHLPAKYERPSSSGLTANVEKSGKNVFDFNLEKN